MDLGSAVLSAEMALDMVDPDVRERAVLCPAPLVEGLVVAAVAAAGGAGPAEVAAEAVGVARREAVPRGRVRRAGESAERAPVDGLTPAARAPSPRS